MIQSVAIITKTGKIIVAKQNVPVTRTKVEGLYATFIRMATTTQHSSFEAESVRFVYRLIEDVYIVLITTLSSNIIEDTEIMNAIIACIQQKMTITSKAVTQGMYEIAFILEEFLQWGFCEKLSVQNVRTNLAMKSRDEELYLHQLEMKKQEAARIAKQKAEEIKEEKELKEKLEMMQRMQSNSLFHEQKKGVNMDYTPFQDIPEQKPEQPKPQPKKTAKKTTKQATKGLQLGKKKQAETLIEEIKKEEQIEEEPVVQKEQKQTQQKQQGTKAAPKEKKLMLSKCIVKLVEESHIVSNFENSTASITLNGSLSIAVCEGCNPELHLSPVGIAAKAQMNPAIDPKAFALRIVKVKEGKKFAVNNPATYVKWNYKSDDVELPITFTCWPAESENGLTLSLSYECAQELKDVVVSIPKLGSVMISNLEGGEIEEGEKIEWVIGNVEEGASGSLELEMEGESLDVSLLFPMNVGYLVEKTMTGNDVEKVVVDGQEIEFEKDVVLKASYQIMP